MKPCPSFPGYSATENGDIISHRIRGTRIAGHIGTMVNIDKNFCHTLSQFTTKKGYKTLSIRLESGRTRSIRAHQMVADAFYGPCPSGLQVRHINGIPFDNSPKNLCYGTAQENADDRHRHGTYLGGSNHKNAKLTGGQAVSIRTKRRLGEKVKSLAKEFDVSVPTIEAIIYGRSYRASLVYFKRVAA
jgi:hypothetical protein